MRFIVCLTVLSTLLLSAYGMEKEGSWGKHGSPAKPHPRSVPTTKKSLQQRMTTRIIEDDIPKIKWVDKEETKQVIFDEHKENTQAIVVENKVSPVVFDEPKENTQAIVVENKFSPVVSKTSSQASGGPKRSRPLERTSPYARNQGKRPRTRPAAEQSYWFPRVPEHKVLKGPELPKEMKNVFKEITRPVSAGGMRPMFPAEHAAAAGAQRRLHQWETEGPKITQSTRHNKWLKAMRGRRMRAARAQKIARGERVRAFPREYTQEEPDTRKKRKVSFVEGDVTDTRVYTLDLPKGIDAELHGPAENRIVMWGFNNEVTRDDLIDFFFPAHVAHVTMDRDPVSGDNVAFIEFDRAEDARDSVVIHSSYDYRRFLQPLGMNVGIDLCPGPFRALDHALTISPTNPHSRAQQDALLEMDAPGFWKWELSVPLVYAKMEGTGDEDRQLKVAVHSAQAAEGLRNYAEAKGLKVTRG